MLLVKTSVIIATHGDVLQVQASLEHLGQKDEAAIVVVEAGDERASRIDQLLTLNR